MNLRGFRNWMLFLFSSLFCLQLSAQKIDSPDGRLRLQILSGIDGSFQYSLFSDNKPVIVNGSLGIMLHHTPSFDKGFTIKSIDTLLVDENWEPVWGEESHIRNHYRELLLTLSQPSVNHRLFKIQFRLFNDGLGFRYIFPEQKDLSHFIVSEELTTFPMTANHKTFWIPGDYDSNEYSYYTTPISEIHAFDGKKENGIAFKKLVNDSLVQTPLLMKTNEGLYIAIHEAALVNYPAMHLQAYRSKWVFTSHLVPDALGNKAYLQTPSQSPWRTIIIGRTAGDILMSRLILNLNEPSKLENTSFIKPGKFVGVWWEMHIGKSTWELGNKDINKIPEEQRSSFVGHGATTKNVKRYIDFAAQHRFDYVLVEGWNIGWEDWFGKWKEDVFDFVTPYPDFDVAVLSKYAKDRGVQLIMHHETSASATNYERQMDTAYRFMQKFGYGSIKTGYVGKIIPRGEHHDGQWMVNHYNRVVQKCAEYRFMIDAHEPVRPTGLHRTYPNWLTSEAARGNEFNAWSIGNPPEHETILPFTRLLGGPMDYTPGIFQIKLDAYREGKTEQIHTTLAKQLALYVTLFSPLQMAADLPENYQKHPDAFQFIKAVPTDWDRTEILDAEPGDFIYTVRKQKGKGNWYVGAITDENARMFNAKLSFLEKGKQYKATIYKDANNAHWQNNPMAYSIETKKVTATTLLNIPLVAGGGCAISIVEE